MQRVASALFIVTFFFVNITAGGRSIGTKSHLIGTAVLTALLWLSVATGAVRGRRLRIVALTMWLSTLVAVLYFGLLQRNVGAGSDTAYLVRGLTYAAVLTTIAAYAVLWYEEERFLQVFSFVGKLSLLIALAGFAVTTATGVPTLTHTGYGSPRLQGLLSEPSAWSPVLPALMILALERKRRLEAVIIGLGVALTKSPTVYLCMVVAVPLFYILRQGNQKHLARRAVVLVAILVLGPLGVSWLSHADADRLIASNRATDVALGRLASGVEAVQTGGEAGRNVRFSGSQVTSEELANNGWQLTGLGPGSSDVFFLAKYGETRAYSLPLAVLFDFGQLALVGFLGLAAVTVWRLRRERAACIFLPFLVATMVNSAHGWESYKFAVLAVALFGLGWRRMAAPEALRQTVPSEQLGLVSVAS